MSTVSETKPTTPAPAARSRRGRWVWPAAAAVAVAVTGGLYYRSHRAGTAPAAVTEDADGAPTVSTDEPVPVGTTRLSKGGIQRTSTQIGSVHPFEEADLFAKVSGYLAELKVDFGDRVKQGQLLAKIDDPEVVADAEKAAADVRQAKAAVEQAVAFIKAAQADRDALVSAEQQAEAEVKRYKSMQTFHSKKYARYKQLVEKRAIPQEIADEEEEAYESAVSNEQASEKAVMKAKADQIAAEARVKKSEADLDEAKANVAVAEAKKDRADALLAYTRIHSPYDGVITNRTFLRGAFIRSAAEGGTTALLHVARTDKVRIVTQVPDLAVPYLDVGDPAEVTLDALPGQVFKGTVSRFAEAEDPASRTMHTEVDLPNTDNRLRAGMYGVARIILDTASKNTTLPASCLVGESRGGHADVYVVKDGKAHKTRIEVGLDDGLRVEVLSGISPDDEVILSTGSVTEGTPVRASQQTAGAGGGGEQPRHGA